jgi:hypothetical protein
MSITADTLLRAHERQRTCCHDMAASQTCRLCGLTERTPTNILATLLALWDQATVDEQLEFLRTASQVGTRKSGVE